MQMRRNTASSGPLQGITWCPEESTLNQIPVVLRTKGSPENSGRDWRGGAELFSMSLRSVASEQMPVPVLGHPFGARQMTLPRAPRPLGFTGRIDVQDDAGHFGPIRAFGVGIKQTQVRDEMFVVVAGQIVGVRRLVGNRGILRWLGHDHVRLLCLKSSQP